MRTNPFGKLDPFNTLFQHLNGMVLLYDRKPDEAIAQFRRLLSTSPNYIPAHFWLWHILHYLGKDKDALAEAMVLAPRLDADGPDVAKALTRGYSEAGYAGAMRRAVAVLEAHSRSSFPDSFSLANIYVQLGEKSQALKWLEYGFDVGDSNAIQTLGMPIFDSLRDEPRFQALVKRMNLPN